MANVIPSTDGALIYIKQDESLVDRCRLYRGNTLLQDGSPPMQISNLSPGTIVQFGEYQVTRIRDDKESEKTPVPSFITLTPLTVVIDGVEETKDYTVEKLDQESYRKLVDKRSDVIYEVEPLYKESANIYFLGEQFVDQVCDSQGTIIYSRNFLRNSALTGAEYWSSAKTSSLDWEISSEVIDGINSKTMRLLSEKVSGQWGYLYNDSMSETVTFKDDETVSIGLTAKSDPVVPINIGLSNVQNNSSTLLAKTFNPSTEFSVLNNTGQAKADLPKLFKIDLTGPSVLPENSLLIGCKAYVQKGEQGPYSIAPEDILT